MNHIEDQANYYKNYHLIKRNIVAVVHVEDEDDKRFWTKQLKNVKSGEYHFVTQSRSEQGKDTKGCEQCLKYRPYINRQFFICIDSDLRLLRGEGGLSPDNWIAQTHTYSWESHSCESDHLEFKVLTEIPDCKFNVVEFLSKFSSIVYTPLLYLVCYRTPTLNQLWNVTKFNKCIPSQLKRDELAENGKLYLQKIERNFESALKSLSLPENYSIEGITPNNAYLHIQGHKIYKLISCIVTLLSKKSVCKVLDNDFPVAGYREIEQVQSDLKYILLGHD